MTTKHQTTRELAWEALKQTRNPEYVAVRYGIPVEKLRAALEKMPHDEPMYKRLKRKSDAISRSDRSELFSRPSDLLPPIEPRERVPGEDDDKE